MWFVPFGLAGCAGSNAVICGDGLCPPGQLCIVDDVRTEATCNTDTVKGFISGGQCHLCVLSTCGDGILDLGEVCDDGNNRSQDGCPANCEAACGDGLIDPLEACDDGNSSSSDGCTNECTL